jgi:hypothetical protein
MTRRTGPAVPDGPGPAENGLGLRHARPRGVGRRHRGGLPDAQHRGEPVPPARGDLGRGGRVVLAEQPSPLGVPDLGVAAAHLAQQRPADLAGERPAVLAGQVLRADADAHAVEDPQRRVDKRRRRQDEQLGPAVGHRRVPPGHGGDLMAPVERLPLPEVHLQADAERQPALRH